MIQWEHPAIILTFIKLLFVIKICVLPFFERPLNTDFTESYSEPKHTLWVLTRAASMSLSKKWIRINYMNIFTLIFFLYERAAKAQTRTQGTEVIKGSYQILS